MSDLVGSVAAVAERLNISEDRVRQLIKEGRIPAWRLGPRTVLVPWRALEEHVNAEARKGVQS